MHHNSMAVITESDWISSVDEQVGLVQKVLCDNEDKAHQNACHLLEGTICHLMKHCGDDMKRFIGCDFQFDWKVILPQLLVFIWANRWVILPTIFICIMTTALALVPEIL